MQPVTPALITLQSVCILVCRWKREVVTPGHAPWQVTETTKTCKILPHQHETSETHSFKSPAGLCAEGKDVAFSWTVVAVEKCTFPYPLFLFVQLYFQRLSQQGTSRAIILWLTSVQFCWAAWNTTTTDGQNTSQNMKRNGVWIEDWGICSKKQRTSKGRVLEVSSFANFCNQKSRLWIAGCVLCENCGGVFKWKTFLWRTPILSAYAPLRTFSWETFGGDLCPATARRLTSGCSTHVIHSRLADLTCHDLDIMRSGVKYWDSRQVVTCE